MGWRVGKPTIQTDSDEQKLDHRCPPMCASVDSTCCPMPPQFPFNVVHWAQYHKYGAFRICLDWECVIIYCVFRLGDTKSTHIVHHAHSLLVIYNLIICYDNRSIPALEYQLRTRNDKPSTMIVNDALSNRQSQSSFRLQSSHNLPPNFIELSLAERSVFISSDHYLFALKYLPMRSVLYARSAIPEHIVFLIHITVAAFLHGS